MPSAERKQRIVSLLASATEITAALGLDDRLVAISHECDYPPHVLDRPRVSRPRFDPSGMESAAIDRAVREAMAEHGSVYEIDGEALERLRPDLVMTQAVCEVCAVPTPGVLDVVRARGLHATEVLSLDAHTIDEILRTILEVGHAAGEKGRAEDYIAGLRERLDRIRSAVAEKQRPRVLALEWLDPPFAPGHWVPEMIETAGGEGLAGELGGHSHEVDWADLERLDPDVLVIMPCGFGLEATVAAANAHAEQLARVASRAIESDRAFAVDGSSYFNRSGPRVMDGVEILAGLLHPDGAAAPSTGKALTWRPPAL